MADLSKTISAIDALLNEFQVAYAEHGSAIRLAVREYQDESDRRFDAEVVFQGWVGSHCMFGDDGEGETEHGRYVTLIIFDGSRGDSANQSFQQLAAKAGAWAAVNLELGKQLLGSAYGIWVSLIHRKMRNADSDDHVGPYWQYRPFAASIETLRQIRADVIAQAEQQSRHAAMRPVARDPATEARDKWLYEQCCKLVLYQSIIRRLDKKPQTWLRITTAQGIKKAATAYADRQTPKLPPIPKRARGRIAGK